MLKKWLTAARIYMDKRMLTMIALGFSSGFPLLLVFGTLNLWLKDAGISYAAIGLFSLVKTPYSFKWAWSPLIDRIRLPLFCRLGRRRGWALFTQIILMLSIFCMSTVNPSASPLTMAFFAVLVTIASASQDIVLDAYRIESFSSKEQGAGVAIFVLGYRFGLIFSGAGAIWMASVMSWNNVYIIMSLGAIIGMIAILCSKEPAQNEKKAQISYSGPLRKRIKKFLLTAVYDPFKDFMRKSDWGIILLFIFFYRMSDAYMGPMAYPFYDDMGFSKREIASITKIYGVAATIGGTLLGGIVVNRLGLIRALLVCGVLQGVSNLVFVAQAYAGHNVYMLMATVAVENISGGMGTAAFVAYLSSLCNVAYTATQYALLSSLMSFARDVFASTSGFLAGSVSWGSFFVITTLMALPGMLVLLYMVSRMKLLPAKPYMADGRK